MLLEEASKGYCPISDAIQRVNEMHGEGSSVSDAHERASNGINSLKHIPEKSCSSAVVTMYGLQEIGRMFISPQETP